MMVILSRGPGRSKAGTTRAEGSIREVCLLGAPSRRPGADPGDSVSWAGRTYRVVATDRGETLHVRPVDHESR